ncbi:ATP synthase subunit I [Velocimicrobium porci]|uniref:ATP synthase subunit I n=1 Tax=Velocimicrobium porci TaxID=2606634 RepID=A0A6L5XVP1_9FIRM|nr:ATP synthase subunit I [Velocimicrobium porci]MSS62885.1 hypothetical protein [Velocimicrobium porci]
MREEKETFWDLLIGIVGLSFIICLIGGAATKGSGVFIAGVCYGGVVALILAIHMFKSLEKTLDLEEDGAIKHARKMTAIRMMIMILAVVIALYLSDWLNLVGVVLGILTLKISAYIQPFIHKGITSKLLYKGR